MLKKILLTSLMVTVFFVIGCGERAKNADSTLPVGDGGETRIALQVESSSQSETESVTENENVKSTAATTESESGIAGKYNIVPKGAQEFTFTAMTRDYDYANKNKGNRYTYSDEDTQIVLTKSNDVAGQIVINDKSISLNEIVDCESTIQPSICVRDVNEDGVKDVVIHWREWRGNELSVIVSQGDKYVECKLDSLEPDINITLLDNYKMKVLSKVCNINETYEVAEGYRKSLIVNGVYTNDGKVVDAGYIGKTTHYLHNAEIGCYSKDEEDYFVIKKHYVNGSSTTGVTLLYTYKMVKGQMTKPEIQFINENWDSM